MLEFPNIREAWVEVTPEVSGHVHTIALNPLNSIILAGLNI